MATDASASLAGRGEPPLPGYGRAALACLLGLLAAIVVLLLIWLLWVTLDIGWGVPLAQWLAPAGVFFAFALAFGLPVALGLGVPVLRALCRCGSVGRTGLAVAGAGLAVLAAAGLWLGLGWHQPLRAAALTAALAVAGAAGGWVAWAVAGAPAVSGFRGPRRWPQQGPPSGRHET